MMQHKASVGRAVGAALVALLLTSCAPTKPSDNPTTLSWSVLNQFNSASQTFAANGGRFTGAFGKKLMITLRGDNPGGVHKLSLDGSGLFSCSSEPDSSGQFLTAPDHLSVTLPHQEMTYQVDSNGQAATHQFLILTYETSKLSCGFHNYGTAGRREYFPTEGTMNLKATGENFFNRTDSGTLDVAS